MLEWIYQGAREERHGEQRVLENDAVVDDVFGQGRAVGIDATTGKIIILFPGDDGKSERKERTWGHVYALAQRYRVQRGRVQANLAAMLGFNADSPVVYAA